MIACKIFEKNILYLLQNDVEKASVLSKKVTYPTRGMSLLFFFVNNFLNIKNFGTVSVMKNQGIFKDNRKIFLCEN